VRKLCDIHKLHQYDAANDPLPFSRVTGNGINTVKEDLLNDKRFWKYLNRADQNWIAHRLVKDAINYSQKHACLHQENVDSDNSCDEAYEDLNDSMEEGPDDVGNDGDEKEEEEEQEDTDEPAIAVPKKNMIPPASVTSARLSQRPIALPKQKAGSVARNLNCNQITGQFTS